MSLGLLDGVSATAAPTCPLPKVSPGSKVQFAVKYDSEQWFSATCLEVYGNARLTLDYVNTGGVTIRRENVCYHLDDFARDRAYVHSCEEYQEGGVWKLDDSSALMQQQLEKLEAQVADLLDEKPKHKKVKEAADSAV